MKISDWSAESLRADRITDNPLIWMVTIDGLAYEARLLPVRPRRQIHQLGLIPYVPTWGPGAGRVRKPTRDSCDP